MASTESDPGVTLLNEPEAEEEEYKPLSEEETLQEIERLNKVVQQYGEPRMTDTFRQLFAQSMRDLFRRAEVESAKKIIMKAATEIYDLVTRPEVSDYSPDVLDSLEDIASECIHIMNCTCLVGDMRHMGDYWRTRMYGLALKQRAEYLRQFRTTV